MPTFNSDEIQVLLIEEVSDKVPKQFEEAAPIMTKLKRGKKRRTNNIGCRISSRVRPNTALAWYDTDKGVYPVAGSPKYVSMRIFFANYVIAGGFTKGALDQNDAEALVDVLTTQIADDTDTLIKEMEQQCWQRGDGFKGSISLSPASIDQKIVTFSAPYGATMLIAGGTYQFYQPGSSVPRSGGGVSSCRLIRHLSSMEAEFDQLPTDVQPGDVITWRGSYMRAIHGFPYHVNDTSVQYQGADRGRYRELKATVYELDGAHLGVNTLDRAMALNKYKMGIGNKTNDFSIWMSPAQMQQLENLGYSMLNITSNEKLDMGYKRVMHKGMEINESTDMPDDTIFGLRMSTFAWYELEGIGLLKEDSLTMRMVPAFTTSGEGSYKPEVVYYIGGSGDIGCESPRENFAIYGASTQNLPTRLEAF